jgi:hypothetical protein
MPGALPGIFYGAVTITDLGLGISASRLICGDGSRKNTGHEFVG